VFRLAICLLTLLLPVLSLAQNQGLRWYVFQSATYLTPEAAKEVHVLLEDLPNDSIIRFNSKFQTFNLATDGAIDVSILCERLNQYGFYLGDITRGKNHATSLSLANTSIFYQAISYSFLNNKAPYNDKWMFLNLMEYQMLSDEVKEKIGADFQHLMVE
jgi:hypothetical protein